MQINFFGLLMVVFAFAGVFFVILSFFAWVFAPPEQEATSFIFGIALALFACAVAFGLLNEAAHLGYV